MISIGFMSAARTRSLFMRVRIVADQVISKMAPFLPLSDAFYDLLDTTLHLARLGRWNKTASAQNLSFEYDNNIPFLMVLCSFFTSFFWASGCAIGDRSSRGITISSSFFSFSFLAFLGDCYGEFLSICPSTAKTNSDRTGSASAISTSSATGSASFLFFSDFSLGIFRTWATVAIGSGIGLGVYLDVPSNLVKRVNFCDVTRRDCQESGP